MSAKPTIRRDEFETTEQVRLGVPGTLQRLDVAVENLERVFSQLDERLVTVCRRSDDDDDVLSVVQDKISPDLSDVARHVDHRVDDLHMLTARVERILTVLDL